MRRYSTALLCAVVLVGGLSTTGILSASSATIGKPAPEFTLIDHTGKSVTLSQLRGKIVVLEWFNAGCPFSKRHHADTPTMKNTAQAYKDKGVEWFAICSNAGGSVDANAKTAEKFGVVYGILNDSSGEVGRAYGAATTPHMFVIDARGNLAYAGAIDNDPQGSQSNPTNYVAKAIDELLTGSTVSTPKTKAYGCPVKYAN